MLDGGDDRDLFKADLGDTVFGGDGGDDFDTLDLTGLGPPVDKLRFHGNGLTVSSSCSTRRQRRRHHQLQNIEASIPCFTPGTLIATPRGETPVEELEAGDRVITRDNGIQEIRWIGAETLDCEGAAPDPHLRPVLIRAGALGNGLPERDMLVSPNHRMLVANDRTALYFEEQRGAGRGQAPGRPARRQAHRVDRHDLHPLHVRPPRGGPVRRGLDRKLPARDQSLKGPATPSARSSTRFPELRTPVGVEATLRPADFEGARGTASVLNPPPGLQQPWRRWSRASRADR